MLFVRTLVAADRSSVLRSVEPSSGVSTVLVGTPADGIRRGAPTPVAGAEGTAVVYVSDEDGDLELFLRGAAGGTEQLTFNEVDDGGPKVSPDQRYLAFARQSDVDDPCHTDLWLMDLTARSESRLLMGPRRRTVVGWSGELILYALGDPGAVQEVRGLTLAGGDVPFDICSDENGDPVCMAMHALPDPLLGQPGPDPTVSVDTVVTTSGSAVTFTLDLDVAAFGAPQIAWIVGEKLSLTTEVPTVSYTYWESGQHYVVAYATDEEVDWGFDDGCRSWIVPLPFVTVE
jgi:hypothetical protein